MAEGYRVKRIACASVDRVAHPEGSTRDVLWAVGRDVGCRECKERSEEQGGG